MSNGPSFEQFFEALHDYGPFPWQSALAERLVQGRPPSFISAPTGLGKTAALDAWVWSLAHDVAARGANRQVPLRAVFVVDRRVIVDAADEHARSLAAALEAPDDPGVEWVAERLRSIGHELARPLEVVKMRGGVSWASRWLRQPDQPAVVAGTVDQFGSRFLFRGYGVSERMRPIDAALVGTDVIAFLDEAHLSTALVSTVRDCVAMEQRARGATGRPTVRIVPMSATPDASAGDDVLTVSDDDRAHPVAGPRLAATKHARLVELPGTTPAKADAELAAELSRRAAAAAGPGQTVLAVCNTIALARAVHERLQREKSIESHLSIGRAREIDKEASRRGWWERLAAGRQDRTHPSETGLVVVSTQTVEVGADLDVDVLVTEAAPLDALTQRFGRVDRLGRVGATESQVVYHGVRAAADRDRVYGGATERTWRWLRSIATDDAGEPVVDMGVASLERALADLSPEERSNLLAPLPDTPALHPDLVDQLARTDPTNGVAFPVDTFLHGVVEPEPRVSVLWRADVEADYEPHEVTAHLLAAPPTTAETVEVPLAHVKAFLRGVRSSEVLTDLDVVTDILARDGGAQRVVDDPTVKGWVVRDTPELAEELRNVELLRPGDLLVLPSSVGGHDRFGWSGAASGAKGAGPTVTADVADLVWTGNPRLRVDHRVFRSLGFENEALDVLEKCAVRLRQQATDVEPDEDAVGDSARELISLLRAAAESSPYARELAGLLSSFEGLDWGMEPSRTKGWVERLPVGERTDQTDSDATGSVLLTLHAPARRRAGGDGAVDTDAIVDVDDRAGTSLTGSEVLLDDHLGAVGERARRFAESLALGPELTRALELAGRAHDLGKVDPRFQVLLWGGDWLRAAANDGSPERALAKSPEVPRSRGPAGPAEWAWPRGMRHEAVSLALLRQIELPADLDRELIEHLVASHHGWARPLFPPVLDDGARQVEARFDGQQVIARSDDALADWSSVGRFHRLCRRYGWWGLALLEAVLRLADMSVSEEGS